MAQMTLTLRRLEALVREGGLGDKIATLGFVYAQVHQTPRFGVSRGHDGDYVMHHLVLFTHIH